MYSRLSVVSLAILAVLLLIGESFAAGPELEWKYDTGGRIYASPMLADLDGDGTVEIIVCASRAGQIMCMNGQGEVKWTYTLQTGTSDGIQATPSILDYDGDGKKEIFYLSNRGIAGCLDSNGTCIWRTSLGEKIDYNGSLLIDINADGRIEILFGSESGTLYCLDDTGQKLWHYQGSGSIRGIPAAAQHPSSGSMYVYASFGNGFFSCIDSEGKAVWSHQEPAERNECRSGPAVGDLDGDGNLEVLFATEDFTVIAYDAFDGTEEWRWKGKFKTDQTHSFALADFDGTGRLDVVCGDGRGLSAPGNLYRLRDGKALWTYEAGGGIVQGPSVGDIDGDGELEILACSRSSRLICLSPDGKEEWSFPTQFGTLTTPALGDVDGDGEVEIVITSKDRHIYCVTMHGAYKKDRMVWPCMNGDNQLTGNANGIPFEAIPSIQPDTQLKDLVLQEFSPLTLGTNQIRLDYANTSHRPKMLELAAEVLGPQGKRTTYTSAKRVEAYTQENAEFEFTALRAGEYALQVRLVDLGSGQTQASIEQSCAMKPLAVEKLEVKTLRSEAKKIIKSKKSSRAADALQAVLTAWDDTLSKSEKTINNKSAGDRDLQETANGIQTALRGLRRCMARIYAAAATNPKHVNELDLAAVPETVLVKVFKDEPYLNEKREAAPIEISLAGNEYEGAQIVVVPLWKDLNALRIQVGECKQTDGSAVIPAENIQVNRIGYVETQVPSYTYKVEKIGFYPDVLFPDDPVDVPKEQDAQPFFLTVKADENTKAGDYQAVVTVTATGCNPVELPLHVHVWDFHISKENHLQTSLWFGEGSLKSFYKYNDRTPFEVRKRYYDLHLEHRSGPLMSFPSGGGAQVEDLRYVMSHGQNALFYNLPGYVPEKDRPVFKEKLLKDRELVKAEGWDDKIYYYTRDEVAVMGAA